MIVGSGEEEQELVGFRSRMRSSGLRAFLLA